MRRREGKLVSGAGTCPNFSGQDSSCYETQNELQAEAIPYQSQYNQNLNQTSAYHGLSFILYSFDTPFPKTFHHGSRSPAETHAPEETQTQTQTQTHAINISIHAPSVPPFVEMSSGNYISPNLVALSLSQHATLSS